MDAMRITINPETKEPQTDAEARQSATRQSQQNPGPDFSGAHGKYITEIKNGETTVRKEAPGRYVAGPSSSDPLNGITNSYGNPVSRVDASADDKITLGGDTMPIKAPKFRPTSVSATA